MLPEFSAIGRQQRLGDACQLSDELFGLRAKGELDSFLCAEEVCGDGEAAFLHLREKQRWPAAFDHAAVNLGDFQIGIDFTIDGNKIVFATEKVEEGTKVSVHLQRKQSGQTGV